MPKVSIIIPTYNRSGLLKDAICSVLAQTLQDSEVIVVDDGSTDDTKSVVESVSDDRIMYFFKTNGGPASARNYGLSKVRGEYIGFLDSDDLWPKNYTEVMISHLENSSEFGGAYSAITVVYPDGRQIKSYNAPEGKSGWITLDLFKRGFVWPSATVFRSSIWKDFYFDELLNKTSEDSDAFLRLSMRTQYLFVPDVQAFHRISADSITGEIGIACSRMLALERFYFRLGGDKIVPVKISKKRLSHACRRIAEDRRCKKARSAALQLYRRAIWYWPYDLRLYLGLLKTFLLNSNKDREPNWKMPEPLGDPIGPSRFN